MNENLDLSKIDFSCNYYEREGREYIKDHIEECKSINIENLCESGMCNTNIDNSCKIVDSSLHRNNKILDYKLTIPKNTILIVYYYKLDKYMATRKEYNKFERNN